jgi:glycosyltransferase involved in cell wall biosynthesis
MTGQKIMSKNILYIAPYRQNDGWGNASLGYLNSIIYACNEKNYSLKIHPVYFSQEIAQNIPEYVRILESETITKFDTIIQKVLPQAIYTDKTSSNVGINVFEVNNLTKNYGIIQPLNQLDKICVPSSIEKRALVDSGVHKPIHTISQVIPCEEIDSAISVIETDNRDFVGLNTKYKDYIKLYFIGTFIKRKNIINLIKAFRSEIMEREKVVLVIKTSHIPDEKKDSFIKSLEKELSTLRFHKGLGSKVLLITENISRYDILKLHYYCDIFVCPSKGEAFCRPLAESMRFGNIPICVENTGPTDYVNNDNGFIIPAIEEQVEYSGNGLLDHDSEYEVGMSPSVLSIRQTIRNAIEIYKTNKELLKYKSDQSKLMTNQFSYQEVGKKLCLLDIV